MYKREKGVVLVVSLIMLLLMTLLGVSAMKTSLMEEKMAGNNHDAELAFQAAETGLRDAELWLVNQITEPQANDNGSNRIWNLNSMDLVTTNAKRWWQERNETWWFDNAVAYAGVIPAVETTPHTIIEYNEFVSDTLLVGNSNIEEGSSYYRITSRGTGGSNQARVLLQTTVVRRY